MPAYFLWFWSYYLYFDVMESQTSYDRARRKSSPVWGCLTRLAAVWAPKLLCRWTHSSGFHYNPISGQILWRLRQNISRVAFPSYLQLWKAEWRWPNYSLATAIITRSLTPYPKVFMHCYVTQYPDASFLTISFAWYAWMSARGADRLKSLWMRLLCLQSLWYHYQSLEQMSSHHRPLAHAERLASPPLPDPQTGLLVSHGACLDSSWR